MADYLQWTFSTMEGEAICPQNLDMNLLSLAITTMFKCTEYIIYCYSILYNFIYEHKACFTEKLVRK